jgi:auxin response factor
MAGIDLNTVEEEDEEEAEALPLPGPGGRGAVCLELWHACAGPVPPLPRKGSAVVYLPQGHLEHIGGDAARGAAAAPVPPHVLCRVVDVTLHVSSCGERNVLELLADKRNLPCSVQADGATDEVYARVSLLPEDEDAEKRAQARVRDDEDADRRDGEDGGAMRPLARTPHMFCKTLTASDTSTHGGFSVPRRAAEDCFPPLVRPLATRERSLLAVVSRLLGLLTLFGVACRTTASRGRLRSLWPRIYTARSGSSDISIEVQLESLLPGLPWLVD